MEKHVVVIYPHPDDESFGAAGTIAKFREQGVPVTYLCGTLGEMGRNMGSPHLQIVRHYQRSENKNYLMPARRWTFKYKCLAIVIRQLNMRIVAR